MQVQIKREKPHDIEEINLLLSLVFKQENIKDFVKEFRTSSHFIPELSRVARINDQIIGIIMYAKVEIVKGRKNLPSIILASIAVLPKYQSLGFGKELIVNSFQKARELGHKSVLAIGQEDYYPQFGFKPAIDFGIGQSLNISDEDLLAMELLPGGLENASGKLKNHALLNELVKFSL